MCIKRGNVVHRLVRLGYLIRSCITCLLRCLSIPEQKGSIRRRNNPQFWCCLRLGACALLFADACQGVLAEGQY